MPRIRALHCNDAMLPLQHYGGMITWHYLQQTDSRSTADRQRAYQKKIRRGELKRFQFALPLEAGIKVEYLCDALQCNRTVYSPG